MRLLKRLFGGASTICLSSLVFLPTVSSLDDKQEITSYTTHSLWLFPSDEDFFVLMAHWCLEHTGTIHKAPI